MISYSSFINAIPNLKKIPLPGAVAQHEMAAVERLEELQTQLLKTKTPKQAAVMMLMYPKDNEAHFTLIERMVSTGAHSGQIAFPGGRREPEDLDDSMTAIRETWEEIGVPMAQQEIIKAATPIYIPPSNYMVAPYIAFAKAELRFTPQPSEVKSVIEVPLSQLLDDDNQSFTSLSTKYMDEVTVPCYLLENQIVWGATAMMLAEFKAMLRQVL